MAENSDMRVANLEANIIIVYASIQARAIRSERN